jgi:hypothetical protein
MHGLPLAGAVRPGSRVRRVRTLHPIRIGRALARGAAAAVARDICAAVWLTGSRQENEMNVWVLVMIALVPGATRCGRASPRSMCRYSNLAQGEHPKPPRQTARRRNIYSNAKKSASSTE